MREGSGGVGVRIRFPYKAEVVDSHNYFLKPKKASEESRREKRVATHCTISRDQNAPHTRCKTTVSESWFAAGSF